ncbi:zf-RVT domain-containing protein [Cephalotus follicularis]|uniref:Zf-RVT domain-containing protein n=1 Tax=Cephalotus follicularis TaxID=3775 RepID=A0A1Q3BK71_CEPFO|nr:zf-RVT domain-containing protein [Cephalotus follicularis]
MRIAFFLWKAVFNAISVDTNIQQRGIPMASKCSCCSNPNTESLDHLLFQGEVGTNIWDYFSKALNLSTCWDMPSLFANWLGKINLSNQFGMVTTAIAALTLWNIWLSRNSARFAGSSMSWISIKNQVITGIHDLSVSFNPKSQGSF